jgi:hypothetical protein
VPDTVVEQYRKLVYQRGASETEEHAVRGRILSDAMSMIGNQSELAHLDREEASLSEEEVFKAAEDALWLDYLLEHTTIRTGLRVTAIG